MNVLLLLTVCEGLSASTLQKIQVTSANVHLASLEMAESMEMVVLVRYIMQMHGELRESGSDNHSPLIYCYRLAAIIIITSE